LGTYAGAVISALIKAPGVTGKSVWLVEPARYGLPAGSNAMALMAVAPMGSSPPNVPLDSR